MKTLAEKLSTYTVILIGLILLIIPSVDFLALYNPTVSGKSILFAYIIETALLLLLLQRIIIMDVIKTTFLDVSLVGLLLYISINRYFFQNHVGFSLRYYELIGLFAFYVLIRNSAYDKIYYWLCLSAVIGANFQIIIGYFQLYGLIGSESRFFKATGSFFNSGPYACYLAVVFPIALFFLKNKKADIFSEKFAAVIRGVLIFNIIGTLTISPVLMSRACFVSIIFGASVIYFNDIQSSFKRLVPGNRRQTLAKGLLVFAAVASILGLFYIKESSAKGRLLILKSAKQMIIDKPFTGYGFDNFRANYMVYQATYLKAHANGPDSLLADNTVYAFNEPVQFVIEEGLLGLFVAAMFIYCLLTINTQRSQLRRLSLLGLTSFFLISVVSYPFEILPIKIIGYLYLAIIAEGSPNFYSAQSFFSRLLKGGIARAAIRSAYVVCLFFLFFCVSRTIQVQSALANWHDGKIMLDRKDYYNSEIAFNTAYPLLLHDGVFLTDYATVLFFRKEYQKEERILKQAKRLTDNTVLEGAIGDCERITKHFKNAEDAYRLATEMKPSSFTYRFSLFKLYQESDQIQMAISSARTLLSMPVKVPSVEVNAIRDNAKVFLSQRQ